MRQTGRKRAQRVSVHDIVAAIQDLSTDDTLHAKLICDGNVLRTNKGR